MANRRVLAVGAHPDDVEIFCAGTLFLLKDQGWDIHVAALSRGDCGSSTEAPETISRQRRAEAKAACRLLGASFHGLGFRDLQIFHDDDSCRQVAALLREVDASLVITHPPQDYMVDHEVTSLLVRTACFTAPMPNYDTLRYTQAPPVDGLPALLYMHPLGGTDLYGEPVRPHFFVDIGEVLERKAAMLSCHASQRDWLRRQHGMDEYLESMRRDARDLGGLAAELAGRPVQAAEAFRQHRGHPYPRENPLARALPERVWDISR